MNLGSSCIYPLHAENPTSEDSFMKGELEPTNSPYAMAKITAIEMGKSMNKQYNHQILNLMPTNLYGPNDNFSPESATVVPALINKIFTAKQQKLESILIWGDGTVTRDFLYVKDAVRGLIRATEKYNESYPVNLASDHEVTISELVNLISDIVDFKGEIKWQRLLNLMLKQERR